MTRQLGRPWGHSDTASAHLTLPQTPTWQYVPNCPTKLLPWQGDLKQAVAERDRPFKASLEEAPTSGDKTTAPLPDPTSTPCYW